MTWLRYLIITFTGVIIVVLLSSQIYSLEHLRANGRTVLLELRPVDPRALMMGDYMALQYAQDRSENIPQDKLEPQGTLIFTDKEGVGEFLRVGDVTTSDEEYKIAYIKERFGINIGSPRFYFENGTAQDYVSARYGVFKVDETGRAILVGLADEDKNVINPKR